MLAWRLSNTLTTGFCLDTVREAIRQYGHPEIFNTGQCCQFTSLECESLLLDQGIQNSMDGRGCWWDDVVVERLWVGGGLSPRVGTRSPCTAGARMLRPIC
jgi:putative transposase